MFVVLGGPVWWTCAVGGSNQSSSWTFTWLYPSNVTSPESTILNYNNGTLYIPEVTDTRLGQYTCSVSDGTNIPISSTAWLRAAYLSDSIEILPTSQSVKLDGTVTLVCNTSGQPRPMLSWTRNGIYLENGTRVTVLNVDSGASNLVITNSSYADAGSYTCLVSHVTLSQPKISQPATLRVYGAPVIVNPPVSLTVPIGYNLTLQCRAISDPAASVIWQFKSLNSPQVLEPLPSSSPTVSIQPDSGALVLVNLTSARSGLYSCTWSNNIGSATASATLIVSGTAQAPNFEERPVDTSLTEGQDLQLVCLGTGNPTPQVFWVTPDGNTVVRTSPPLDSDNTTQRIFVDENGNLTVLGVTNNDAGEYICRLVNPSGVAESHVLVTVWYGPNLISLPSTLSVDKGSDLILPCSASGQPQPTIMWALPRNSSLDYNSTFSENDGQSSSTASVATGGVLTVLNASEEDNGVYTCHAFSRLRSVESSVLVTVADRPVIYDKPVSQLVIEGESVTLQCQVTADPPAQVNWYHRYLPDPAVASTDLGKVMSESISASGVPTNFMTLLTPNQDPHYNMFNVTSLHMDQVNGSDAGLYICLATNEKGSAYEYATLRVMMPPTFRVRPQDTKTVIGGSARIDCRLEGIPVPSQQWLFNDSYLEANSRMSKYANYSLFINNVQASDFGTYTCLGSNQAGQSRSSANLYPSPLPIFQTWPTNVTVIAGSPAKLKCRGDSPDELDMLWFLSDEAGSPLELISQVTLHAANLSQETEPAESRNRTWISPDGDLMFDCTDTLDSGWYMCLLRNSIGNVSSPAAFLEVDYPPVILSVEAPAWNGLNEPVNLTCHAHGRPRPVVTWMSPQWVEYTAQNTGSLLNLTETTSDTEVVSTAFIDQLLEDHAGQWSCRACNLAGCRLQKVSLDLTGAPVITDVDSREDNDQYVVTCVTAGEPTPEVNYEVQGNPISNLTDGHSVSKGELLIRKNSIASNYSCQAANVYGNATVELSGPQPVRIDSLETFVNSLLLSLQYSEPVRSLHPNQLLLHYRLDATNLWYNRTYPLSSHLDDYFQDSPNPPTNSTGNDTCIAVGRRISKRDVSWTSSVSKDLNVSITSTGQQLNYSIEARIHDLQPGSNYSLQIAMSNFLAAGPYSPVVTASTLTAALSPVSDMTVSVVANTATVSWINPDHLGNSPENITVKVSLYDSANLSIALLVVKILDKPQAVFPQLQPGNYRVEAVVLYQQPDSFSSPVSANFNIPDEPPTFRTNITNVHASSDSSVLVSWIVPANATLIFPAVTGYEVEISAWNNNININNNNTNNNDSNIDDISNQTSQVKVFNVSGWSVSTLTADNLQPNSPYGVRVASSNEVGPGPYSDLVNVTTLAAGLVSEAPANSTPSLVMVVVVAVVCSLLVIVTVVVLSVHYIRMVRRRKGEEEDGRDTDTLHQHSAEREPDQDTNTRAVQELDNEGFILY